MKLYLFVISVFLLSSTSFSSYCNLSCDSITFKSESEGLIILTQNPDSINLYIKTGNYPNPFAPTMKDFAVKINTHDTTFLIISIKDAYNNEVHTFRWEKIIPGAYRFDWWKYIKMNELKSGVYYTEVITRKGSETNKTIIVK